MADGDDDDRDPVILDPAEDAVVLYSVAPVAPEVAEEAFAEGGRISGAFDAFFKETLNVRSGR